MTDKIQHYTLVQHSGFGYGHDPQFEQAVEERFCTPGEAKTVQKVGGVLFHDYDAACAAVDVANYSDFNDETVGLVSAQSLIPRFEGTFARVVVDGLRIAIPSEPTRRRINALRKVAQ